MVDSLVNQSLQFLKKIKMISLVFLGLVGPNTEFQQCDVVSIYQPQSISDNYLSHAHAIQFCINETNPSSMVQSTQPLRIEKW